MKVHPEITLPVYCPEVGIAHIWEVLIMILHVNPKTTNSGLADVVYDDDGENSDDDDDRVAKFWIAS